MKDKLYIRYNSNHLTDIVTSCKTHHIQLKRKINQNIYIVVKLFIAINNMSQKIWFQVQCINTLKLHWNNVFWNWFRTWFVTINLTKNYELLTKMNSDHLLFFGKIFFKNFLTLVRSCCFSSSLTSWRRLKPKNIFLFSSVHTKSCELLG